MYNETKKVHALLKLKCSRSFLRMTGANSQHRFSVIAMVPSSEMLCLSEEIEDALGKNAHLYNINVMELSFWRCWFDKHQIS